jgi:hypothetical protein
LEHAGSADLFDEPVERIGQRFLVRFGQILQLSVGVGPDPNSDC